jgi:hypothetical protein
MVEGRTWNSSVWSAILTKARSENPEFNGLGVSMRSRRTEKYVVKVFAWYRGRVCADMRPREF